MTLHDPLKPREIEILRLMADGLTNREIGEQLYIGFETVKWYAKQIYGKLEVSSRQAAADKAQELSLFDEAHATETSTEIRNNLPVQITPFVGRESEINELVALVTQPAIRLVTILATGGMGKTRLSLEVAIRCLTEGFPNGVFFISLQPISTPEHIVSALASSVGYQFQTDGRDPKQQILDFLSKQRMLLLIDNWEHLLDGVPLLLEILQIAPDVRILATSREKLNLSSETVYTLSGMQYPTWETPEDALEYDAVQLLVQSARRVKPDWDVTQDNLDYVARICRLTQGMPLGILLAASWLDTLSLKDIANEIQQNIDFLETEMRDVPRRQRSIRAIFEYTWDKLKPNEQDVFMRLSVFRGGFTRGAGHAIAGTTVRLLQTFVNKALLSRDIGGRYTVHELLRQYGEEQLNTIIDADIIRDKHSEYYLTYLASLESQVKGHGQQDALDDIEDDFENIRLAWEWAIKNDMLNRLHISAEALMWFCAMRNHPHDGLALLSQAKKGVANQKANELISMHLTIRHYALGAFSRIAIEDTDNLTTCLAYAQQHELTYDIVLILWIEARSVYLEHQNYEQALGLFEQMLTYCQKLDDDFYIACALDRIGYCNVVLGNFEQSQIFREKSLKIRRSIGNDYGTAICLVNLALIYMVQDKYDTSLQYFKEVLGMGHRLKSPGSMAWVHSMLSWLHFCAGEFRQTREQLMEAKALLQQADNAESEGLFYVLQGLLVIIEGDYITGQNFTRRGMNIVELTNPGLVPWAHCSLAFAHCGLKQFKEMNEQLEMLFRLVDVGQNIPIIGFWCALKAVYFAEQGQYQQSAICLGFVRDKEYKTFGWAKHWSLLQEAQSIVEQKLDEPTFRSGWDVGRNMTLEDVREYILRETL